MYIKPKNLQDKLFIRQQILDKYKNFNKSLYKEANANICQNLVDLLHPYDNQLSSSQEKIVGLYWPIRAEPDLFDIFPLIKYQVALPKIYRKEMIFVPYKIGDNLEKSNFTNLYQPLQNIEVIPQIIVVPGLGFSIQGRRVGYGYGYYDKYLAKIQHTTRVPTIGVCFHENLFEYLPFEDHDLKVKYMTTDKIIIDLSKKWEI